MNIFRRTEELILMLFWGYRELKKDWEITNRDLSTEISKRNTAERKVENLEKDIEKLLTRCYDVIDMVEDTRLKRTTKDKIIDKLRGIA